MSWKLSNNNVALLIDKVRDKVLTLRLLCFPLSSQSLSRKGSSVVLSSNRHPPPRVGGAMFTSYGATSPISLPRRRWRLAK